MATLLSCLQAVASTVQRVDHENRLVNQYTARDFTPFRFMPWSEVPSTHMLAYFLNPKEDHGQGTLFQDIFLEHLRKLPAVATRLPRTGWRVEAERRHGDLGQIDLLLTAADNSFGICLENKPRDQTIDQPQQLARYLQLLQQRHGEDYLILYLSRAARPPHENSLDTETRERLLGSGQYANLTYGEFILPLLDAWYQAVYPETLRSFLRNFRQKVEQWLDFSTTKPAQLMQDQEVINTLSASPIYVSTAFDIANALGTLKQHLRETLVQQLADASGLVGGEHWQWKGFLTGKSERPFLLRRTLTDDSIAPTCWPWGRYSISFEFEGNRMFYGIRFDRINWLASDGTADAWTATAPTQLALLLGNAHPPTEWWPWSKWVGPETEQELYTAIADKSLVKSLQSEVIRLSQALDQFCGITT